MEVQLEKDLQVKHQTYLLMNQHYWMQRARVEWAINGDMNSRFFHATAITRKRRNTIVAIQNSEGYWETDMRRIMQLFIAHYKTIYTKRATTQVQLNFPVEVLNGLPKVPQYLGPALTSQPIDDEIYQTLMTLGPDKAPGPDGINAHAIQ